MIGAISVEVLGPPIFGETGAFLCRNLNAMVVEIREKWIAKIRICAPVALWRGGRTPRVVIDVSLTRSFAHRSGATLTQVSGRRRMRAMKSREQSQIWVRYRRRSAKNNSICHGTVTFFAQIPKLVGKYSLNRISTARGVASVQRVTTEFTTRSISTVRLSIMESLDSDRANNVAKRNGQKGYHRSRLPMSPTQMTSASEEQNRNEQSTIRHDLLQIVLV
jgi:hypothetical protein